jgi:hypothetical protein
VTGCHFQGEAILELRGSIFLIAITAMTNRRP